MSEFNGNMASQYVQDDTGTYIPATQRPDGTWRKARRVREGYIPQEEMPLYESKGKQFAKSKPTLPVGLDPCYAIKRDGSKTIPGLNESIVTTKSSKKKKKKKNAASHEKDINDSLAKVEISSTDLKTITSESPPEENFKAQPVATDLVKRLRNLRKKLKDINALKLKIESGELANPEKDQLEKVARQKEIEAEIEELEFEIENE